MIKKYTKQTLTDVRGPITVVSGKNRRLTFIECPNDISSMTITKTYLIKILDKELNYEIIKDSEKISDIPPMPITSYKVEHDSVLRRMFK